MNAFAQQIIFAGARTNYFVLSPVRARRRAKTCELSKITSSCISMGMKNTDPTRDFISGETELLTWLELATPGACSIYHVGHLASDRSPETSNLSAAMRAELNSTAHRVMALVEQGALIAVQQRFDNGHFAYLAMKAHPRSSRSRASRGNLPPSHHCHVPGVTSRTDDIAAAQVPSSSGNSPSPVNTSIAQLPVAR